MRRHELCIGGRAVTLVEGPAGWGECSPLAGYPCDPAMALRSAEEVAREGFPSAHRSSVAVNALVDGTEFDAEALAGFPAVKVKLRVPGDVDLVARVRDAVGPTVALRVDANGAFDVDTAVRLLGDLARYDVELAEQPAATLDELAVVRRRSPIPVAADECVRGIDDARRLRELEAADVVVLKVQPLGGVRAALDVADVAGVPALPTLTLACGLGTAGALGGDVTTAPLVPVDGRLTLRTVVPDDALLARYAAPERSSQVVSS
jgi:O-succinylbenzoate synthase